MKAVAITSENLHKSNETFRTAEPIFSMNNLLTLMNGVHQQQEPSPSNPTGGSPPMTLGNSTMISQDVSLYYSIFATVQSTISLKRDS